MFLFLLPWRLPQVNRNNQNLWSSLNVGIFHQTWRATQFSHSLEGRDELRAESWELVTKSEHLLMWGCGPSLDTDCLIIRKLILRFYSDENIDWWRTLTGTGCIYGKQTRGRVIKLLKKVFWLKWSPIVINCLWHRTKRRLKSEGT